jgi:large conductance mechanosensitive channel
MGMLKEFKDFAMRGNVVDMAVGFIMGTAFGKIVSSLVADVIMPPIGYLVGGVKFTNLNYTFPALPIGMPDPADPTKTLAPPTIEYGKFLQATFDFIIIAFCVFLLVKVVNYATRKKEEAPKPAEQSPQEKLLAEIRDLLAAKK